MPPQRHCAMSPPLLPLLFLSLMVLCQTQDSGQIYLTVMHSNVYNGKSKVTLRCDSSMAGTTLEGVTYYRSVGNGSSPLQLVEQVDGMSVEVTREQPTILFGPDLEGLYSCRSGGLESNEIEILAFPRQDLAVRSQQLYSSAVGEAVVLDCVYKPGVLSHRYTIEWFKGLVKISGFDTPAPARYEVLDNFSLSISAVEVGDASNAFHCAVQVDGHYRLGPNFELEVAEALRVTQPITDAAARPGDLATFRCTASGSPAITLRWLYRGAGLDQLPGNQRERFSVRSDGDDVWSVENPRAVSTLTVTRAEDQDSGSIQCAALQTKADGIVVATTTASLVVLAKPIDVTLQKIQEGGARLRVTLPAPLSAPFSLVVQYTHGQDSSHDVELFDPSFIHTNSVNYVIPADKLPGFSTFSVQVAVKVAGAMGTFTNPSNTITIMQLEGISPTSGGVDTSTIGIIVAVGLFVILTCVLVAVGVVFFVHYCTGRGAHHQREISPPTRGKKFPPPPPGGRVEKGNEYTEYMVMSAADPVAQKLGPLSSSPQEDQEEEEEDGEDYKSEGSDDYSSHSNLPSRSPSPGPTGQPEEVVYETIPEKSRQSNTRDDGATGGEMDRAVGRAVGGAMGGDLVRKMSSEDMFAARNTTRIPREGASRGGSGRDSTATASFSMTVPALPEGTDC